MHIRKSIRLEGFDYSRPGAYFVTICSHERGDAFGEIRNGQIELNPIGHIIGRRWQWLPEQYDHIELDEWLIMPDHLHGIVYILNNSSGISGGGGVLSCSGVSRDATIRPSKSKSLGSLIDTFKTISTKKINEISDAPGMIIWQRNFYEHIIRDEFELNHIRDYIINNPLRWELDNGNPSKS